MSKSPACSSLHVLSISTRFSFAVNARLVTRQKAAREKLGATQVKAIRPRVADELETRPIG